MWRKETLRAEDVTISRNKDWLLCYFIYSQSSVYTSPLPHTCYMYRPSRSSRFDHSKVFGEECISLSFSFCTFLLSFLALSFLGPNILHNTLFPNTLSLRSSFSVSDQVSYAYKKRQNYSSVYLKLDIFIGNWKTDSAPNDSRHSLTSTCS